MRYVIVCDYLINTGKRIILSSEKKYQYITTSNGCNKEHH